jgi:murein DD-endopeptidase MepM/ murein hydrolase activator NlpD
MRFACLVIGLLWNAFAGAEVLYRLPWQDGLSFMFTQTPGGRVTTHFTRATLHAVDIAMPADVPIVAARAGVVEAFEAHHGASADEDPLTYEGNFVRVRHDDATAAIYAHLRHRGVIVAVGKAVQTGQTLGYSGATGDVLQPHLHFAVVRSEPDDLGGRADVSLPVTFYVGTPPVAFRARAAVTVAANYSAPAEPPRAPSEGPLIPWKRPALSADDEASAWQQLVLWLACGVVALAWFWRFSRT